MTRQWPVAGVVLAVLWLFVRGVATVTGAVEELIIGLGVGLPIAYVTRNLYTNLVSVRRGLRSVPYAAVYLGLFLWELLTANVEVAYRVLAPSMPIHPDVIEVPLRVRNDFSITTIANSITLTPGTLTMDYDPDRNALYVHAISGQDRQAVVDPIRRWEDLALVIFDEDLSPGDPVPDLDPGSDATDADAAPASDEGSERRADEAASERRADEAGSERAADGETSGGETDG